MAIRLGPEANAAADGRRPFMLQIELAVEITLDLLARDRDLEIMPGARRGRRIANPFDLRAPPILELPEHEIVFKWIGAESQIVAVGLEIEQDAGALVTSEG